MCWFDECLSTGKDENEKQLENVRIFSHFYAYDVSVATVLHRLAEKNWCINVVLFLVNKTLIWSWIPRLFSKCFSIKYEILINSEMSHLKEQLPVQPTHFWFKHHQLQLQAPPPIDDSVAWTDTDNVVILFPRRLLIVVSTINYVGFIFSLDLLIFLIWKIKVKTLKQMPH